MRKSITWEPGRRFVLGRGTGVPRPTAHLRSQVALSKASPPGTAKMILGVGRGVLCDLRLQH